MNRLSRTAECLLILALLLLPPLLAARGSAEAVIRHLTGQIYFQLETGCGKGKAEFDSQVQRLEQLLLPHVDFARIARWVMGRHWKQASEPQRQQLKQAFRELLVRTLVRSVGGILPEYIHYLPPRVDLERNRAVVRTEVRRPGLAMLPIDYHLYRREGRWRVFDVRFEGVSLMTGYRTSFSAEIREHGIGGLISSLQQQNRKHPETDDSRSSVAGAC